MGARNILLFFILAVLTYQLLAYAQQCPLQSSSLPANITLNSLFSVISLALMLSFMVVSIGFVITKVVPGTKLEGWLKNEYWEIAKSAILAAGAIGIMVFLGNISLLLINQAPVTSGGISAINSELNTISTSATGTLCNIYSDISGSQYALNTFNTLQNIGILKSVTLGWWIPLPLFEVGAFTFGSTFNIYNNPMLESTPNNGQYESFINDTINFLYLPIAIFIILLYYTIQSIIFIGMMILVPLGIIFRAFPFLRNIGGTLFAFGVGLSIVLPMLIILINGPISNMLNTMFSGISPSNQLSSPLSSSLGIIFTLLDPIGSLVNYAVNIASYIPYTMSIYPALNAVAPFFLFLFAQLLLLVLDMMIWYPLVDSIAKSLGGTIRLSLGGRLKIG